MPTQCREIFERFGRWLVAGLIAWSLSIPLVQADTLRCGTSLISPGDLALRVREKCGDPVSEELIGYTLKGTRRGEDGIEREFKIEQWIYGPEEGYYHVLTLEAGRLRSIENIRQ